MQKILGSKVHLWPEMATVYHFSMDDLHSSGSWPKWARWGWCMGHEVLEVINRFYRFNWDIQEFLQRFAFSPEYLAETGKLPLGIVVVRDSTVALFRPYRADLVPELSETCFYVPAGWTKDVFWALYNECTQFKVLDNPAGRKPTRALTACREDGRGVYYV